MKRFFGLKVNGLSRSGSVLTVLAAVMLFLAGCGLLPADPKASAGTVPPEADSVSTLAVERPVEGGTFHRSSLEYFEGEFNTVWAGQYLDEAPARARAAQFQARGLTAFTVRKTLAQEGFLDFFDYFDLFDGDPVGDFYLVMVGFFGLQEEAEILGRRLRAEELLDEYAVVPVDDAAEVRQSGRQNQDLADQALKTSAEAFERAAQPLAPDSPVNTGEAFKKTVYGRYIGTYQDIYEARAEAEALTASGWPAAVRAEQSGGRQRYRVYLAPPQDHKNYTADEQVLQAAQQSTANQPGIVFLVDVSKTAGHNGVVAPADSYDDASACAGYSEAGRLFSSVARTIIYIPDTSYLAALKVVDQLSAPDPDGSWWWPWGDASSSRGGLRYGLTIFNRPALEQALAGLKPDTEPASLAQGLIHVDKELSGITGRKILLVFSEFQPTDQPAAVQEAFGRLKQKYGRSLTTLFIFGDTDDQGYRLARDLAAAAGPGGQPFDSCRLLRDNTYFESYIKTIFR